MMNLSAHAAHYRLWTNAGDVRAESRGGRDWLVAPVVLVKEGVLNGGFLPAEEIRKSVNGWNGRPVTVGHPQSGGEFVSANSPEARDEFSIGMIFNAEYREDDAALVGEAWIDVALARQRGESATSVVDRLAAFIEGEASEDDLMDVSTGYFHQFTETPGTFNGERYNEEQFNLLPDHLAILPNEEGACSIADGCGTPRVQVLGAGNQGEVYQTHDLLHGTGQVADEPAESGADTTTPMGARTQRLVENHGFDAENLPSEDTECFAQIYEAFEADPDESDDDATEQAQPAPEEEPAATDGGADQVQGEPLTRDDLEAVKAELREELKAEQNAERSAALVETITDNSEHTADDLADWGVDQLEVLAEMVAPASTPAPSGTGVNYAGRGRGGPATNADDELPDEVPFVIHATEGEEAD